MTAEVEKRIVQMRFENEQFEKGAKQSMRTLEKLEGILDTLGSGGLDHLTRTLDTVQDRFSTLGIVGASAIQSITNQVMSLAANLLTAIPRQIISGGINRATNIEQAKFQLKGLGVAWEDVSDDINEAVYQTAFGLDEAAMAASQFAASFKSEFWTDATETMNGVDHKVSKMAVSLRAISGVAGMTNSSFSEIANIFTGIAGTGYVMTQDLRMLESRGLNVAAKLAEVLSDGPNRIKYTEQQIREMISKGEIDFYTFAKAMDYAFGQHAKDANETFTGSLANMKAALSRIGADFVTPIHSGLTKVQNSLRETFDRARKLTQPFAEGEFTNWMDRAADFAVKLSNSIDFKWLEKLLPLAGKGLNVILDLTEKLYQRFKAVSFWIRTVFRLNASKRLENIKAIIIAIGDALKVPRDIIKALSSKAYTIGKAIMGMADKVLQKIANAARSFSAFIEKARSSSGYWKSITNFANGFMKLFENLSRGASALGEIFSILAGRALNKLSQKLPLLSGVMEKLGGFIVNVSGSMADWLESIRDYLREHESFAGALGEVSGIFGGMFKGIDWVFTVLGKFLSGLLGFEEGADIWKNLGETFGRVGTIIRNTFSSIRTAIGDFFSPGGGGKQAIEIAAGLYTALIGWRKLQAVSWSIDRVGRGFTFLKSALSGSWNTLKALNIEEWGNRIQTVLGRTSGALRAFADNLNAKSLLTIAGAVVALGFGLTILASVAEGGHLASALTALTYTMALLIAALWALQRIVFGKTFWAKEFTGWANLFKMFANAIGRAITQWFQAQVLKEVAKALVIFAAAILILVVAIGALAAIIKWAKPGTFIGAVAAITLLAGVLVAVAWALSAMLKTTGMFDATKFVMMGAAIVMISASLLLLTGAVAALAFIAHKDSEALWQGVAAIGLLVVVLALAVGILGSIAGSSPTVAAGMLAIGVTFLLVASAMLIVSAAVAVLVLALWGLAQIPTEQLAANAKVLGDALIALALSLTLMSLIGKPAGLIAASLAMLVMAGAVLVLAGALLMLSLADPDKLAKNLLSLIGVIVVLAVVLIALTALGPMVLVAAFSLLLVGAAAMLLASAFLTVSTAMAELGVALQLYEGLDIASIGAGLGKLAGGLVKIGLASLFFGKDTDFSNLIPLGTGLRVLEDLDFDKLADGLPKLAKGIRKLGFAGLNLMIGDTGLMAAGPGFISLAEGLKVLTPQLNKLGEIQDPEKVKSLLEAVAYDGQLLGTMGIFNKQSDTSGIASAIQTIVPALLDLEKLENPSKVEEILDTLANSIQAFSQRGLFTKQNDVQGIGLGLKYIAEALLSITDEQIARLGTLGEALLTDFESGMSRAKTQILTVFTGMIDDMAIKVTGHIPTWYSLGLDVALGISEGIRGGISAAVAAAQALASSIETGFTISLKINSPSKVMERLASFIPAGIASGIQNGSSEVANSMTIMMSPALAVLQALMDSDYDFSPRITPVVDMSNVSSAAGSLGGMFTDPALAAQFNGSIPSRFDFAGNAAAAMSGLSTVTNGGDNYVFNIYPSAGMDEDALADSIMYRMQELSNRRRVALG